MTAASCRIFSTFCILALRARHVDAWPRRRTAPRRTADRKNGSRSRMLPCDTPGRAPSCRADGAPRRWRRRALCSTPPRTSSAGTHGHREIDAGLLELIAQRFARRLLPWTVVVADDDGQIDAVRRTPPPSAAAGRRPRRAPPAAAESIPDERARRENCSPPSRALRTPALDGRVVRRLDDGAAHADVVERLDVDLHAAAQASAPSRPRGSARPEWTWPARAARASARRSHRRCRTPAPRPDSPARSCRSGSRPGIRRRPSSESPCRRWSWPTRLRMQRSPTRSSASV